jgi:hypothetical protein
MRSAALLLTNVRSIANHHGGRVAKPRRDAHIRRALRAAQRRANTTIANRGMHRSVAPRIRPTVQPPAIGFAGMPLH